MATQATLMTAEQYYLLPEEGKRSELVSGEVVHMTPPGGDHAEIVGSIVVPVKSFVRQHDLGRVVVEGGFILRHHPDTVRIPDISLISKPRAPAGRLPKTYMDMAPDLAIEVVSPGDTASHLQQKTDEYLAAGCREIWLVYPDTRTVMVLRADGSAQRFTANDILVSNDLLPGFSVAVREFFE